MWPDERKEDAAQWGGGEWQRHVYAGDQQCTTHAHTHTHTRARAHTQHSQNCTYRLCSAIRLALLKLK